MDAAILTIGTELTQGSTVDTNSSYFAGALYEEGIPVVMMCSVADDRRKILETLRLLCESADLLIISGGLGPTRDDLTRECVAEFTACPLEFQESILEDIAAKFKSYSLSMPEENENQAYIPAGARILKNPLGTAPGFSIKHRDTLIVCFPGVPRELKHMFPAFVRDGLEKQQDLTRQVNWIRTLGGSESRLDQVISPFCEKQGWEYGTVAHSGHVDIRITAAPGEPVIAMVTEYLEKCDPQMARRIYSDTLRTSIVRALLNILQEKGLTLALVESCTGGMIAQNLTGEAGASQILWGGWVAYSNECKQEQLNISPEILKKEGAVSARTAHALAAHARMKSGADIALSVTGIAGPGGGGEHKPVGTVYVGLHTKDRKTVLHFHFRGDREMVRVRTMYSVWSLLWDYLHDYDISQSAWAGLQRIIEEE